jgi:hypothetical protein
LPFSNQDKQLEAKPPAYAELFQVSPAQDADQVIEAANENPETQSLAIALRDPLIETLGFLKLTDSNAEIAEAIGIEGQQVPRLLFGEGDAHRFAAHVEKNIEYFKTYLPEDPGARQKILDDVDNMLRQSLEPRRADVLLRWFRDPAAPADLNPNKLIDPRDEARGNLLQLIHPVLFNAALLAVCIAAVVLVFAYNFKEGR